MKVLFVLNNMTIGGIEKSFLSLVNALPQNYEIHLLLLKKEGGFYNDIPKRVLILNEFSDFKIENYLGVKSFDRIKSFFKKGLIIKSIKGLWFAILYRLTKNAKCSYKVYEWQLPDIKHSYDLAIAYHNTVNFISYFVANNVNAKKKMQWIHTDLSKLKHDIASNRPLYKKFHEIVAVSNAAKSSFLNYYPELSGRTKVFYNIVDENNLNELSLATKSNFDDAYDGVRILTVGRVSRDKGFDLAIDAVCSLIKEGFKLRYYIIGEGEYEGKLKEQVVKLQLENQIVFLGAKSNPYGYMRHTDIYLQPSRHEGQCITVWEAKVFNIPMVLTAFPTAYEAVIDGQTGLIVELNTEGIYSGLKKLLTDKNLRTQLRTNLQKENENSAKRMLPF